MGLPAPTATREFVTVEVRTDDGIEGIGITFFGGPLTKALREAVDALGELIIGEDPLRVGGDRATSCGVPVRRRRGRAASSRWRYRRSISRLWDIKGKALGQPVATLIGGHRDRVRRTPAAPCCASIRSTTWRRPDRGLSAMGFKQMKTQMGAEPTVQASVDRIRVLRDGIGPDIDLMCDINQLWDVQHATVVGKRVEEYGLFWLEDVVAHDDYQGLARVADALTTPIAAGEYVYGIAPFRQLLENRSIDIVMIDLLRVGGVTQFVKVAGMAEAFNLPVVSHLIPEFQMHMIAGIANGLTVEYMPWTLRFFEETPAIEDGADRGAGQAGVRVEVRRGGAEEVPGGLGAGPLSIRVRFPRRS